MKLKLALLVVSAVAGGGASVALADHGGHDGHGGPNGPACRPVHLSGTLAAQSLSLVVAKGPSAGTTVALALPAGARANVEACSTGTGTAAVLTVRHVELNVQPPRPAPPTTTGTTTGTTTDH
jgi:hypothetical protein